MSHYDRYNQRGRDDRRPDQDRPRYERRHSPEYRNERYSRNGPSRSRSPRRYERQDYRRETGYDQRGLRDPRDRPRDFRDGPRDGPRDLRDGPRDGPRDLRDGPRDGPRDFHSQRQFQNDARKPFEKRFEDDGRSKRTLEFDPKVEFDPVKHNWGQPKPGHKPSQPSSPKNEDDLPAPWQKAVSSKGKVYYYNPETDQTQWNMPK